MTSPRKPAPPDGWRYVRKGERIQSGDVAAEYGVGKWHPVSHYQTFLTYAGRHSVRWYCRKKKERKS